MNTNYILMCREAVELQEQWEPKPGDRIYNPMPSIHAEYNIDILTHYHKNENGGHDIERVLINENLSFLGYSTVQSESDIKTRFKWVPRIEDLQEILQKSNAPYFEEENLNMGTNLIYFLYHWTSDLLIKNPKCYELLINDLNIQWLCFVMETVYNKTWNGQIWEVIK